MFDGELVTEAVAVGLDVAVAVAVAVPVCDGDAVPELV